MGQSSPSLVLSSIYLGPGYSHSVLAQYLGVFTLHRFNVGCSLKAKNGQAFLALKLIQCLPTLSLSPYLQNHSILFHQSPLCISVPHRLLIVSPFNRLPTSDPPKNRSSTLLQATSRRSPVIPIHSSLICSTSASCLAASAVGRIS
ncbi:unnamed protein product [Protopolystoma xenopodis]|uniref:Uncharacterized protein n=1 Tax=Protopolystoma xenopodis TaxID=117903 RepID=A0A448XBU9_9PLAT|nr:unnamed protein product [Protopolystoma xenopodis]